MKLKVQVLSLLMISFLDLYSSKRCRQEDVLVYDCTNLLLTDLPSERLGHVYKLDLSHNEITILKNDTFLDRNLVDVAILYMQDNKITTVEVNAFRGMGELDFLNLNNNDIVDVPTGLFEFNTRLRFLRFENNTRLQLPQKGFNLPDLNVLDLERCGLETIPPNFFDDMRDLEILYLRGNRLSHLDPGLIQPLHELEFLDLRENLFTELQLDILRMPMLFKVSFVGNPFGCECALLRAYSLYKKKAPFEDLSCKNANDTLKTDLVKLATQLECSPTTMLPFTQFSTVSVPNQNSTSYSGAENLSAPQVNDQIVTETSLTPFQLGAVVMSIVLLIILVIISIIFIHRKRTDKPSVTITNKFKILNEDEGEVNCSFDQINNI